MANLSVAVIVPNIWWHHSNAVPMVVVHGTTRHKLNKNWLSAKMMQTIRTDILDGMLLMLLGLEFTSFYLRLMWYSVLGALPAQLRIM